MFNKILFQCLLTSQCLYIKRPNFTLARNGLVPVTDVLTQADTQQVGLEDWFLSEVGDFLCLQYPLKKRKWSFMNSFIDKHLKNKGKEMLMTSKTRGWWQFTCYHGGAERKRMLSLHHLSSFHSFEASSWPDSCPHLPWLSLWMYIGGVFPTNCVQSLLLFILIDHCISLCFASFAYPQKSLNLRNFNSILHLKIWRNASDYLPWFLLKVSMLSLLLCLRMSDPVSRTTVSLGHQSWRYSNDQNLLLVSLWML